MKRRDEVLVGIVATAALVLAIIGSLYLARGGLAPGYPVYSVFEWGAGLKQGQPVMLSGVTVGYVSGVEFRRDGNLVVAMRIYDEFEVPLGTISAASVTISIPLILLVLFFQKRIVAGLTAGAVKG